MREERFSIAVPVRRIPVGLEEKVDNMVEDTLAKNIILESESPWSVDYRQLNAVTLSPIYPIPEAVQLFDSLEGAKVFSVLDLSHGYYNVEVEETDNNRNKDCFRNPSPLI